VRAPPNSSTSKRRAVFLDRDDTLIPDIPYLGDPARVTLLPGARDALVRLHDAGFLLIMVSNQSGVARGLITYDQVRTVNAEVARQLLPAPIDATYFSPDGPDEPSETRKPAPGLLLRAAREHNIDLARSFMVGDKVSDIECGRRAGCQTVRIAAGPPPPTEPSPNFTASGLAEASEWILHQP